MSAAKPTSKRAATAGTARPRRTQAERSARTRAKLLDATIECLVEHGYEGTTTARVAEAAGLSRGAHLHHFQTRAALVAAAVSQLANRRGEEISQRALMVPAGQARVASALDLMWGAFSGPLFAAALELIVAARTDGELRRRLEPIERELDARMMEMFRELLADGGSVDDLNRRIELALNAIRGLAVLALMRGSEESVAAQWAFAREQLLELLTAPGRAD